MKVYLACSMTNSHDPALLQLIVTEIQRLGHRVLSEHVAASTKEESMRMLMHNAALDPNLMPTIDPEDLALIIRENDFRWIEECDAFIGLFFGGSDGRGAEFEHLRLLMELKRNRRLGGLGRGDSLYELQCKGILGLFDKQTYSRLIWARNIPEESYYQRVFVDPTNTEAILKEIGSFLETLKREGDACAQS